MSEMDEVAQRKLLLAHGWIPVEAQLGEGGGARVFKVVSGKAAGRLAPPLFPNDKDRANRQALDLAQTIAEIADGTLRVLAAGKVAKDPSFRFEREVQALRDVQHPNLVSMLDCEPTDSRWYVMPLMRRGTLGDAAARWKGDVRGVVRGMLQLAGALGALHEKKIVHRDVKPKNVFVSDAGEWILGDLGVAYREDGTDHTTTRPVSKDWFPRWYGDPLGHGTAVDIYMLAETAMYLLTGGEKLLDPGHVSKPKFDLPALFPSVPGVREVHTLLRSLITSEPDDIAASNGTELAALLRRVLPAVEHDELTVLRQELQRVRSEPRLVYTYSAQRVGDGDAVGVHRVRTWFPAGEHLEIWINVPHDRAFILTVLDDLGQQVAESEPLAMETSTPMALPPQVAGRWGQLSLRSTVSLGAGHIKSLTVHAVGHRDPGT